MGWEPIIYKHRSFDLNNQLISWLQKYMEIFFLSYNHPFWFNEVLADLHGNFHVPHGKYFFDEDIIGDDQERLTYCLDMIDLTIEKIKSTSKREFFNTIRESLKESWCDISNTFYNQEWLDDDKGFRETYIETLTKLKEIMQE
mgnify:CR=1 FL=1